MSLSRPGSALGPARLAILAAIVLLAAVPATAEAHGPIAPVASTYLAQVTEIPAGFEAKVVDGDLRMWLEAPPSATVIVLDYRNAPYLRFSPSGIQVNENSSMYYLNQTPVPEVPPTNLSSSTPPSWHSVSGGHAYQWHDGRLHALAAIALQPGTNYVGRWTVPIELNGRLTSISGTVLHAAHPSIVWFWPIMVLLACVLAAWRVRDPALDARLARGLALTALIATTVAALGHQLHGRPTVSAGQLVELVAILAFVGWGLRRVLRERPGYFAYFAIAFVALWQGLTLVSTLVYGFVLIALPAFLARTASVVCLASGAGILLLVYRLAGTKPKALRPRTREATAPEHEAELHVG
jgi:hypothetical protein